MAGPARSVRHAVAGLVWVLCGPAALLHLFAVVVCLIALPEGGPTPLETTKRVLTCAGITVGYGAWYALHRMSADWLDHRPAHWRWPALCAATAVIGVMPLAKVWYVPVGLASPGIFFAIYLSVWHLRARCAAARVSAI